MSLFVEQVILIIALLVFPLGKNTSYARNNSIAQSTAGTGRGQLPQKSKDVLIPKLKQPLVALVFGMKEGVFIPGLGFYLSDRSGAIYFLFCTKSEFV